MYYIERNTITDAMFLTGSVGEPSASETAWVPGTYSVGTEVIRPSTHRVYRCAVARSPTDTLPPEIDVTSWADIRPTDRYLPFGPHTRTNGKVVYQNYPLKSTTSDIEYRLLQRYANALAFFGTKGATWRVQIYDKPESSGGVLVHERTGRVKSSATGYWQYAYGKRYSTDRVFIYDLPIFSSAEIRIIIEGTGSQERAISQIEVGKLRYLPGAFPGGVEYGISRSPKIFTTRSIEDNGTTSILIYGTGYDMNGSVIINKEVENNVLSQLRLLLGKGAAYIPTLTDDFQQSLVFGLLKSADVVRPSPSHSTINIQIEGLPT